MNTQVLRLLIFIGLSLVLLSCQSIIPTVLTETVEGEKLTMQEVQETGDRDDVPASEKASSVVSMTTFSHASGKIAKVIVTKSKWNPFAKPKTYFNCINCHTQSPQELGLAVEQPKDPWYKWPLILLIGIGIAAVIWFWDKIKGISKPLTGILGFAARIFKRRR